MTDLRRNMTIAEVQNTISTVNSSTIPLGGGATFTGTLEDITNYVMFSVSVCSDVASATDGLSVEQSSDGTNWDLLDVYTVPAATCKTYTFNRGFKYVRVRYTNGIVAQSVFRLQTIYSSVYGKPSSHRIQDAISSDDDAELVKSVITGEDESGVFRNTKVDPEGRLEVVAQPYLFSIAEGVIVNHSPLAKFGSRTAVASATASTVWEGPTALYAYMAAAQQLKVSSTSAQDGVAGTGILTLTIEGLDAAFAEISETVTMNGLGVVTTASSFIRVTRAYGVTCGTSYTNVGTISIMDNAGVVTQAIISPGDAQTLMAIWTVPAGKVLYISGAIASTDTNKGAKISIFTRQLDGGTLYPWRIKFRQYIFSGSQDYPFPMPFKIPAKTDVEIQVLTPAAAGVTSVGADFVGWYEDV